MKKQLLTLSMILVLIASFSFLSAFAAAADSKPTKLSVNGAEYDLTDTENAKMLSTADQILYSGEIAAGKITVAYPAEDAVYDEAFVANRIDGATEGVAQKTKLEIGKVTVGTKDYKKDLSKAKAKIGEKVVIEIWTAPVAAKEDVKDTDGKITTGGWAEYKGLKLQTITFTVGAKQLPAPKSAKFDIDTETLTVEADTNKVYYRVIKGKGAFPTADALAKGGKWVEIPLTEKKGNANISKLLKDFSIIEVVESSELPGKTDVSTSSEETGAVQAKWYVKARPTKPQKVSISKYNSIAIMDETDNTKVAGYASAAEFTGLAAGWQWQLTNAPTWSVPFADAAAVTAFNKDQAVAAVAAKEYKFRIAPVTKSTADADLTGKTAELAPTPASPEVKAKVAAIAKSGAPKVDYKKMTVKASDKWEVLKPGEDGKDATDWTAAKKLYTIVGAGTDTAATNLAADKLEFNTAYVFRVPASAKKPASEIFRVGVDEGTEWEVPDDEAEAAEWANSYFAQIEKKGAYTLVPAQGALIEWNNAGKWKKGLPKGDLAAVEIRLPGTATAPGSTSLWVNFKASDGKLFVADTKEGLAASGIKHIPMGYAWDAAEEEVTPPSGG